MSPLCLESQGCHWIPFVTLSTGFSILLTLFFQKLVLRDRLFLYGSCLEARRSKLVSGMCIMFCSGLEARRNKLVSCMCIMFLYGAGVCCYGFM